MTGAGRPARRVRVLWNPAAGRKAGLPTNRADAALLRDLMDRHGLGDDLVETASEEDGRAAARRAVGDGCDVVVAAGGDGTAGLVAGELLDGGAALGILPLGSVMNIPRMLGLPRDLEAAADVLRDGPVRTIDVAEARGQAFYEAASVGFHAAISRELPRLDAGDHGAVLRSIVAAFRYRPSRVAVELDDDPARTIRTRALLVAVANGPYLGAGFTVAPDADLGDGLLDVRIFRHWSKRELVRHFAAIAFGRRAWTPHVTAARAARVRVTGARPLPARADARDLGTTPVELRIRPAALRVVAPAPDPVRAPGLAPVPDPWAVPGSGRAGT